MHFSAHLHSKSWKCLPKLGKSMFFVGPICLTLEILTSDMKGPYCGLVLFTSQGVLIQIVNKVTFFTTTENSNLMSQCKFKHHSKQSFCGRGGASYQLLAVHIHFLYRDVIFPRKRGFPCFPMLVRSFL